MKQTSLIYLLVLSLFQLSLTYEWLEYGFSSLRNGYNPYESSITSSNLEEHGLDMTWLTPINGAVLSQPLFVSNIIIQGKSFDMVYVSSENGYVYGINYITGELVWEKNIGIYSGSNCAAYTLGSSTPIVDKDSGSLFVVSSDGNLHRLLLSTGAEFSSGWPLMSIFDASVYQTYGAISKYENTIYVAISARCPSSTSSYESKLFSFEFNSINSVVYTNSFSLPDAGSNIAGSGGVSISSTTGFPRIYMATSMNGRTFNSNQHSGYIESIIELNTGLFKQHSLTLQQSSSLHTNYDDSSTYDFITTPVVLTPTNKCSQTLIATINRAGELYISTNELKSLQRIDLTANNNYDDMTFSSPAFDPATNILYVTTPGNVMYAYELSNACSFTMEWRTYLLDSSTASVAASAGEDGKWSSPVVAAGVVYVASGTHNVAVALSGKNGAILWESSVFGSILTQPIIINGRLIIVDSGASGNGFDSQVYCYQLVQKDGNRENGEEGYDQIDMSNVDGDTAVNGYYYTYYYPGPAAKPNNFIVTVGTNLINMQSILSIGLSGKNGGGNGGDLIQKVFVFQGTAFDKKEYTYFFRVPMGGVAGIVRMMQENSIKWEDGTDDRDVSRLDPNSLLETKLGVYDSNSWTLRNDGSLSVNFTNGDFSSCFNHMTAIFKCGTTARLQFTFTELQRCENVVIVSSSKYCSTLPTVASNPSPSRVPTIIPSRTPSTTPSTAPSARPSARPTAFPTTTPSRAPTTAPSVVPVAGATGTPSRAPLAAPSATPSRSPSASPSRTPVTPPSAAPVAATDVHSYFSVVIEGVSVADIGTKEIEAIVNTIADVCSVQTSVVSVSKVESAARRLSALSSMATTASSSTIYFSIVKVLQSGDTESSVYTALNTALTVAQNGGSFTSTLQSQASAVGASALLSSATVTAVNGLGSTTSAASPSLSPRANPTRSPSLSPSRTPSTTPSISPTRVPSKTPVDGPTVEPSFEPSVIPSISHFPTGVPSKIPTVEPTISQEPTLGNTVEPTAQPTEVPVPVPTVSPSISLEPTVVGQTRPPSPGSSPPPATVLPSGSCISLALLDSFGDGWDNARLMVFPSVGEPYALSPGCSSDVVTSFFCFTPDKYQTGDFVVIGVVGYKPSHSWEIFWQARNEADGTIFSGSYTTSMTFVYRRTDLSDASLGSITMMNQLPDELTCRACEAHSNKNDDNGFLLDALYSPSTLTSSFNSNDNEALSTSFLRRPIGSLFDLHTRKKPQSDLLDTRPDVEIGRGAIGGQISFAIYGAQDTWVGSEGYGTSFFIFDTSAQRLFYSGNLCGGVVSGSTGSCQVKLEAGQYVWRVSSSGGADVYWEFCGVKGDSKTELIFNWEHNQCTPVKASAINKLCSQQQQLQQQQSSGLSSSTATSTATTTTTWDRSSSSSSFPSSQDILLDVALRLTGLGGTHLSEHDLVILQEAIAYELSDSAPIADISPSQVTVLSVVAVDHDLVTTLQVRIQSHQFGISSQDLLNGGSADVTNDLRSYLQRSLTSGLFLARIKSLISSSNSDDYELVYATDVRLTALYIDPYKQYRIQHSTFTDFHITFLGCGLGFVFGVILVAFISNRYSNNNSSGRGISAFAEGGTGVEGGTPNQLDPELPGDLGVNRIRWGEQQRPAGVSGLELSMGVVKKAIAAKDTNHKSSHSNDNNNSNSSSKNNNNITSSR